MAARAIYIASGHGGNDPGAVANGLRERDVNRAIGARLVARLREHGLLVHTDLERGNLRASGEIADARRRGDVAVFVSLHHNAATASARGLEVFKTGSGRSLRLAKALHAAILYELRALDPTWKDRKVKEARGTRAQSLVCDSPGAAALIEFAFLSNDEDAEVVAAPAYANAMAEAACRAIVGFMRAEKLATATYRPQAKAPPKPAAEKPPTKPAPKKLRVRWLVKHADGSPHGTFDNTEIDLAFERVRKIAMAERGASVEKLVD
jgi:N-acetylmuramoyl-L-alanine amidase